MMLFVIMYITSLKEFKKRQREWNNVGKEFVKKCINLELGLVYNLSLLI